MGADSAAGDRIRILIAEDTQLLYEARRADHAYCEWHLMTHLRSLGDFLDELDEIGDLQTIETEVDWNFEVSAIIRRCYDLTAPAPLFTNLTGYQGAGFRLFGAPGALSSGEHRFARIALALGLSAGASGQHIVEALAAARKKPGIPQVIYNCLLAGLYPDGRQPVKGSFENGWPAEILQRVFENWHAYGYR